MLIQLEIENYASFRNLTRLSFVHAKTEQFDYRLSHIQPIITGSLNLPLLNLAIIFGANASGKSNLLEAVEALWKMVVDQETTAIIRPFIFDERTLNAGTYIELTLLLESKIYRYGLVVEAGVVLEEWLVLEVSGDSPNQMLFYRSGTTELTLDENWPPLTDVQLKADRLYLGTLVNMGFAPISLLSQWFSQKIMKVKMQDTLLLPQDNYADIFKRYHALFVNLLQLTDPAILDFRANTTNNNFEIRRLYHDYEGKQRMMPNWLPFETYVSTGTEHMLSLVTLILDALEQNKILIIDEWDTHLHHLVARYLLQYIQESASHAQFILSSHDILLLDSDLLEPDQIWFVEKNRSGISSLYSIDEFMDIDEHFRNNQIVRQYLNGRYGAIPFVSPVSPLTRYTDGEKGGESVE